MRTLLFILLCALGLNTWAQDFPIPQDRRINWNPGVRGGIPGVTNIYVTLSAATTTAAIIQAHINAAPSNSAILLLNGRYELDNDLQMKSGVVLRGESQTNVVVWWQNVNEDSGLNRRLIQFNNNFDYNWDLNTARSLDAPLKGESVIRTFTAHGLSLGDIVLIDMKTNWISGMFETNIVETPALSGIFVTNRYWWGTNDWHYGDSGTDLFPVSNAGTLGYATWVGRPENIKVGDWDLFNGGQRPMGQWVRITAVNNSTNASIDPPIYYSYNREPEMVKMAGLIHYAGLESMTLSNELDEVYGNAQDNIELSGSINCWMKDVTIFGSERRDLWVYGALWFEMRGCILDGAIPIGEDATTLGINEALQYSSDRAYPVFFGPHCTAALITDNIFMRKTMGIAFEGCAAGNVVSYNFITNIYWRNFASESDWPGRFSILMHGPHPFMNLIEGNWCSDRIRADEYWGTSSHFVNYRNRVEQHDRGSPHSQSWTIDVERNNDFWSFVANSIGGGNVEEDNYEFINGETASYVSTKWTIWKVGYKSLGNGITNYSFNTFNTMIRFGNWCFRTNDIVAGSGVTLHQDNISGDPRYPYYPPSLYLTVAPTNFGGLRWPPYGATAGSDNAATNIPAGHRFYFGTNRTASRLTNYHKLSGTFKLTGNTK